MATLKNFRKDTRAINDGAWVRVNEAIYDDLEILTRGFTDEFVDAQNRRMAYAAERYNGDRGQIPNAVQRDINAALAREFLVLDVRNLTDDDGTPLGLDAFLATLNDPAYLDLARACFDAASQVSRRAALQLKAAVGNSGPGSPGT